MSNAGETPETPQILRRIPPERFRKLIETLLGEPLQHLTGTVHQPSWGFIG